jgi:cellulose synthase/poly-beta-1,6-N-acetylglucosamine synthase-like glycosyltransferase
MEQVLKVLTALFLIDSLVLVYTWAGYPAILWILRRTFPRPINRDNHEPAVSLILAVHNEEAEIADKLNDCQRLVYPKDRLEIIVVSDGSSDGTDDIVRGFAASDPQIRLLRSERIGKSGAQNMAVQHATGEILIFTDAGTRTRTDLLHVLIRNFADSSVGLVTSIVFFGHPGETEIKGQGFYSRYEFFLRQAESDIGTLATGTGTALAMRRALFTPMPSCYGDDCILPLDVRLQGYRVVQDEDAVVYDTMPHTAASELRARIRMTTRNWTGTLSRPGLLNPFRYPLTALCLVSHKMLRWVTPFLMVLAFVLNTALALSHPLTAVWLAQFLFYSVAFVGWQRVKRNRRGGIFAYPFSFCLANLGFVLGILKALRRQRVVSY